MKKFLIRWGVMALSIFIAAHLVPGIEVPGFGVVLVVALVLGVVNAILRPVILLVTLPINILTLGLLTFFINGALFYFVSHLVKGFVITSYWSAFFGYILVSIVSLFLNYLASSASPQPGTPAT